MKSKLFVSFLLLQSIIAADMNAKHAKQSVPLWQDPVRNAENRKTDVSDYFAYETMPSRSLHVS